MFIDKNIVNSGDFFVHKYSNIWSENHFDIVNFSLDFDFSRLVHIFALASV